MEITKKSYSIAPEALKRCLVRNLPAPELGFLVAGGNYQGRSEDAGQTLCTRFLKNALHNKTTHKKAPNILT